MFDNDFLSVDVVTRPVINYVLLLSLYSLFIPYLISCRLIISL